MNVQTTRKRATRRARQAVRQLLRRRQPASQRVTQQGMGVQAASGQALQLKQLRKLVDGADEIGMPDEAVVSAETASATVSDLAGMRLSADSSRRTGV